MSPLPTKAPPTTEPSSTLSGHTAARGLLGQQAEVLQEIALLVAAIDKADSATVVDRMGTLSVGLEYRRTTAEGVWTDPCLADAMAAWSAALSGMKTHVDDAIAATEGGDADAPSKLTSTTLTGLIPTFQDAVDLTKTLVDSC